MIRTTSPWPGPAEDDLIGWVSAGITVLVVAVWAAANEGSAKYVLYALPGLILLVHLVARDFTVRVDPAAVFALCAYTTAAGLSLVENRSLAANGSRDLLIVGGYLLLFTLRFRAPPRIVDLVTAGLAVSLAIEGVRVGVNSSFSLLTSEGIVESTLAFPFGIILLYNLGERRWGAAVVSFLLLFAASKRIALAGVVAAVLFDPVLRSVGLSRWARAIAAITVVACSLVALFSAPLFEFVADLIAAEDVSANSVALGRFDFAKEIWDAHGDATLGRFLFGFGPAAADAVLEQHLEPITNPHNDWLKILFDYGAFGFVAMHAALFALFGRTRFGRSIYIYAAALMMTDNTFIYMVHQAVVALVLRTDRAEPGAVAQAAPSWVPATQGRG